LQSLLPYFIASLNDSAYEATATTYSEAVVNGSPNGISGVVSGQIYLAGQQYDQTLSRGNNLQDGDVEAELWHYISLGSANGGFDFSKNAVYLLIPGQGVTVTDNVGKTLCANECGYNNVGSGGGQYFTYASVTDAFACGGSCSWNIQTPNTAGGVDNNGAIDGELDTIAHEVNEAITDPSGLGGGWVMPLVNGPNLQMADYCQPAGNTYSADFYTALGQYYGVQLGGGTTAFANVHGIDGTDFLLQTLRVNPPSRTQGYCASGYGGVFWGHNFGYSHSPVGDWAPGRYKGECLSGQALAGISRYTSAPQAHAVMCNSTWNSANFVQSSSSCSPIFFDPGDHRLYTGDSDWDYGYYKAECGQNQFVAGVSQSTSGVVNGILCCTPPSPGAVTHQGCQRELVNSTLDAPPDPTWDWDNGYYKATCSYSDGGVLAGYVAGVSANVSSGTVHGILCCTP
jgi:hypothetical protein